MTPLFKQGESFDLNNYRPISVISVVAKVFEKTVYDQLYNFLNSEEIISKQQSGFRCQTLNCYCTSRRSWLRQCRSVSRLKKAFDTVDREISLAKMNRCGIQGKTLDWFKSYLTDRT